MARGSIDNPCAGPYALRENFMTTLEVAVPESLLSALRRAPHELASEMRLAATIHWYQQGAISMERAAEAAGMSRAEFLTELGRRRVDVFVVDPEDLARELARV
jgi:predicted HTH domain antitoxin